MERVNYSAKHHLKRLEKQKSKTFKRWLKFKDQQWIPLDNETQLMQTFILGRSCLYIEREIQDITLLLCPNPDQVKPKATFSNKVKLLKTLSPFFAKQMAEVILAINELRNNVMHDLDYKITRMDIDKISRACNSPAIKVPRNVSNIDNLINIIEYVTGNMAAIRSLTEADPALALLIFSRGDLKKAHLTKNLSKIIDVSSFGSLLEQLKDKEVRKA